MYRFHIMLRAKDGGEAGFGDLIEKEFIPAIEAREGFRSLFLGQANTGSGAEYALDLDFDTADLRTAWGDSAEHKQIMARLPDFVDILGAKGYELVADHPPSDPSVLGPRTDPAV
jgi:hypothetical protein